MNPDELLEAYEPGDPKAWALSNEDWTHSTHDEGAARLSDMVLTHIKRRTLADLGMVHGPEDQEAILNSHQGGEHMGTDENTSTETTGGGDAKLSAVDTTLDLMIERASLPSLVSLYRQGKQSGLIQPSVQYAFDANGQKVRVKN